MDFAEHKRARQQTGRHALGTYLAAFDRFAKPCLRVSRTRSVPGSLQARRIRSEKVPVRQRTALRAALRPGHDRPNASAPIRRTGSPARSLRRAPWSKRSPTRLMKWPLAPPGRDFCTASGERLDVLDQLLLAGTGSFTGRRPARCRPFRRTRNSTEPPLAPFTAVATSCMVTVPTFGFGIRPARTQNLAETADQRHQVGGGDHAPVEIDGAALHLLHQVFGADDVGAGAALASSALTPRGEHGDADRAARAVRCRLTTTAHHLIGVTRIDAEIHRHFDSLVELRLGAFA